MRAEHVPQPFVTSLADQVQVDLAERRQPAVRVVDDVDALAVAHREPVVGGRAGHDPGEQAGVVHPGERLDLLALSDHVHLVGVRAQHPHDDAVGVGVRAEHRVRVVVRPVEQALDGRGIRLAGIDPRIVDRLLLLAIHVGTLLTPPTWRR